MFDFDDKNFTVELFCTNKLSTFCVAKCEDTNRHFVYVVVSPISDSTDKHIYRIGGTHDDEKSAIIHKDNLVKLLRIGAAC